MLVAKMGGSSIPTQQCPESNATGALRIWGWPMWRNPSLIEAQVRELMAQRAALPDAYPHRKDRWLLLAAIEAGLDDWLLASRLGAA